jgi:hypothetical protein
MNIRLGSLWILCVLAFAVLTSASTASAAEWKMNATGLGEKPTGEASEKTETTAGAVLEIKGVTSIKCTGSKLEKVKLVGTNKVEGKGSATGCKASAPCKVPETITSKPLVGEVSAGTAPEDVITIKPATGETFANLELSGETCPLAGTQPIKGKVKAKMPEGQKELLRQSFSVNSTGELKVGTSEATLTDILIIILTDGSDWSWD